MVALYGISVKNIFVRKCHAMNDISNETVVPIILQIVLYHPISDDRLWLFKALE